MSPIHELTPHLMRVCVEQIQKTTQRDNTFHLLIQQMLESWPENCKSPPMILRPFWQLKDDLATEHSCITSKGRLFINEILISKCLQTLHNSHPGITYMQLKAHTSMFWPPINKEIGDHVQSYVPCKIISNPQQKEPAMLMEIPCRPWEIIGNGIYSYIIINITFYLLITTANYHRYRK